MLTAGHPLNPSILVLLFVAFDANVIAVVGDSIAIIGKLVVTALLAR